MLVLLLTTGCADEAANRSSDPPVPVAAAPRKSGDAGAKSATGSRVLNTGPFEKKFEGIRFSVPAGWKEVELLPQQQGFIEARFEIPTSEGPVALTFSSNGGGIDSNIQRWMGQFEPAGDQRPVVEDLSVSGKTAKWVDLRGEFHGGPMAAASPAGGRIERMLGVAIPLGSRDFYLKLTGSNAAVDKVRDDFRNFVREGRTSS